MLALQCIQNVNVASSSQKSSIFQFKPWLVRMFGNTNMAQILQSHAVLYDHQDPHVVDI